MYRTQTRRPVFAATPLFYLTGSPSPPGPVQVGWLIPRRRILGTPDRGDVYRAASALSDVLNREVNATIVSADRWEASEEGFIRDVKRSPLVLLDLTDDAGDAGA